MSTYAERAKANCLAEQAAAASAQQLNKDPMAGLELAPLAIAYGWRDPVLVKVPLEEKENET